MRINHPLPYQANQKIPIKREKNPPWKKEEEKEEKEEEKKKKKEISPDEPALKNTVHYSRVSSDEDAINPDPVPPPRILVSPSGVSCSYPPVCLYFTWQDLRLVAATVAGVVVR